MTHKDDCCIVKLANYDQVKDIQMRLDKIEQMLIINCNRNVLDIRKRAYQEGWSNCNSAALAFCRYMVEVLGVKSPAELEEFFEVEDSFDIYKKLEAAGVLMWDPRINAFREVPHDD